MKQLSRWGSFYWVIPIVLFVLAIVVLIEKQTWKKKVLIALLIIYGIVYSYLTFFYRRPGRQMVTFSLFHSFIEAVEYQGPFENNQTARAMLFNVLLYIPLGLLFGSYFQGKMRTTIFIGIGLSVLTECLQYITRLGIADVDDVLHNALGVLFGSYIFILTLKIQKFMGKIGT